MPQDTFLNQQKAYSLTNGVFFASHHFGENIRHWICVSASRGDRLRSLVPRIGGVLAGAFLAKPTGKQRVTESKNSAYR